MDRIIPHGLLLIKLSILLTIFCHTAHAQSEGILLENINLIDGTGNGVQQAKSIWIVEDRIKAILDYGKDKAPNASQRHDLKGKYVLPGLIDAHVHFGTDPSGSDNLENTQKKLKTFLEHGITGVRDMAGDTRYLSFMARQAQLDLIASPDIYYSALMAGPRFFNDPRTVASAQGEIPGETAWMRAIDGNTDIALAVAEAKGTGATGIKLYADLPGDLCQKIIVEARRQGIKVWAHASVLPAIPMDLVEPGIHSLSHANLLAWQVSDKAPSMGRFRYNETELDPATPAFQALLDKMAERQVYLDPTIKIFLGRDLLYKNAVDATKAAYKAGVPIVVGTDMSLNHRNVELFPLIDEMKMLVEVVGIPAGEVIKAATLNTAQLLGIDAQVGSLTVGKKANLIVLDKNPLEDITHLNKVKWVLKNGKQVK